MNMKEFIDTIIKNLGCLPEDISHYPWLDGQVLFSAQTQNNQIVIQYTVGGEWIVFGTGSKGVAKTLSSALAERQRVIFIDQDRRRVIELVTTQFRHEGLLSSLLGMTVRLSEEDRRNLQWSFSWGSTPKNKALVHFTPEGVISRVQTWSGLNWNQRGGYGSPLVDVQLP